MAINCPYCGGRAELATGAKIYPHRPDLARLNYYLCSPCDAWVGCHRGTITPLGRLADAQLRTWKVWAHEIFDRMVRRKFGRDARSAGYAWLAEQLGINPTDCHVAMFDVATCQRVIAMCRLHTQECSET